MEMDIISLISNVGFPIAAFLLMFWFNSKLIIKNTEAINNLKAVIEKCLVKTN